jgi:hypothetical protein
MLVYRYVEPIAPESTRPRARGAPEGVIGIPGRETG